MTDKTNEASSSRVHSGNGYGMFLLHEYFYPRAHRPHRTAANNTLGSGRSYSEGTTSLLTMTVRGDRFIDDDFYTRITAQ